MLTVLYLLSKFNLYVGQLNIIGFDFFKKATIIEDKQHSVVVPSHNWTLGIPRFDFLNKSSVKNSIVDHPAHDQRMEEEFFRENIDNGKIRHHVISDMKRTIQQSNNYNYRPNVEKSSYNKYKEAFEKQVSRND